MTVEEMLERTSSLEISEWMAYEKVHGPLDDSYTNEALATIQETLQAVIAAIGTIAGGDAQMKLTPFKRPFQVFLAEEEEEAPKLHATAEKAGDAAALNAYFDVIEKAEKQKLEGIVTPEMGPTKLGE